MSVGEPRQRSVGGNAGLGEEFSVGAVAGAAEAEGCAARDWGAGGMSRTWMTGDTLGRALGSAWTAALGCSRMVTDPAEVVPVPLPPVSWPGAVAQAGPRRAAVASSMEGLRITSP